MRYFYKFAEREPHGLKNEALRKKVAALQKQNVVALDHYPLSCIHELLKLSKYTRARLHKVSAPTLIVHAKEDDLTSTKSAHTAFKGISSEVKKYIELENSYHMVVLDNEREFVFEQAINFITKSAILCNCPKSASL
jgi:carboxylesterase